MYSLAEFLGCIFFSLEGTAYNKTDVMTTLSFPPFHKQSVLLTFVLDSFSHKPFGPLNVCLMLDQPHFFLMEFVISVIVVGEHNID